MSDELKVPKRRVQVEVLLPGGGMRQVTVFLSDFASHHGGPERLSDLLNGPDEFVPALDAQTDTMTFLGRGSIAAARVAPEWEIDPALAGSEEHEVEITLVEGMQLRGTLRYALPPGRTRLLDHLNDAQSFVRLEERDNIALINKRHIARVVALP
jgi:hypothetical protein